DALLEQSSKARVRQRDEPPRCYTIGLVPELLRPHVVEIFEDRFLEELRVQFRHAVDRHASYAGKVRHAHATHSVSPPLVDERHAREPRGLVEEANVDIVQKADVDLVDDLEMPWQRALKEFHRPGLECLR